MKFKINSKFNIKNPQSILKHDFYQVQGYKSGKKKKSIIRFRDIDCLFPTMPAKKPIKKTDIIFTGIRDTDQDHLFPTVPAASSSSLEQTETKLKKKKPQKMKIKKKKKKKQQLSQPMMIVASNKDPSLGLLRVLGEYVG